MPKNQKIVFLYALVLTLILFNIGIFFGVQLESSRIDRVEDLFLRTEIDLLDQEVQRQALRELDLSCSQLFDEIVQFGDRIFEEASKISEIENANQFSTNIVSQHQRFDLLRTQFWLNSISLKEECNLDYHNVVYFYDFEDVPIDVKAEQNFFSNALFKVKQEQGSNILLIPIAADLDSPSIKIILDFYNISEEELPVIFIDEKVKITRITSFEDINKHL